MKKLFILLTAAGLAAGVCRLLRADDAGPMVSGATPYDANNAYLWGVEHATAIAHDPDAAGVQAVIAAADMLKNQPPQVQIDFFNKGLFDTKSRTVQRAIRFQLFKLYSSQGQNDKATDQLQQLMNDD